MRVVVVLAALLVGLTAVTPAHASGSASGSKTCAAYVSVKTEASGTIKFFVPNDDSVPERTVYYGWIYDVAYYHSSYTSTTWKVTATGIFGYGYAYCKPV